MKNSIRISLLFLLVFVFSCSSKTSNMDKVVDNILNIYEEKPIIEKIEDSKQIINIQDAQGNKLKCFYYYKRPDKLKIDIKTIDGNSIIRTIYNKENGKHTIFGQDRGMTKEEIKEYEILVESWIDRYSVYKKESFKFIKNIEENDLEYHVFEITNKFGQKHLVYANSKTGVIDMIEEAHIDVISLQKTQRKIVTKTYKKYDNISYPQEVFVYTFHDNNKSTPEPMVMSLESVMHNTGIDNKEFEIK